MGLGSQQVMPGRDTGEDSQRIGKSGSWNGVDGAGWPFRHERLAVEGMTCGSCVTRVEKALLSVRGVASARVDLAAGAAIVSYDSSLVALPALSGAVRTAGYDLHEMAAADRLEEPPLVQQRRFQIWPFVAGIVAAGLLASLYIGIVGVAQGLDHAFELVTGDWYFVIPIVIGFGIQVGLFAHVRSGLHLRKGTGSTTALTGAGTGTSTVSMVACCAHHLTDVLPIMGLSGAALFLNEYRGPLMGLGILTNAVGIAVMMRLIRKSRRDICTGN